MFFYYVPRGDAGAAFRVPPHLAYTIDRGATVTRREVLAGPNGSGPGWLFMLGTDPTRDLKWDTQTQTWAPIFHAVDGVPVNPQCYVGRWNDATLEPAKLQRPTLLDGHNVALGDGSVWVAAVARGFDVESAGYYTPLPKTLAYDSSTGKWRAVRVAKEYRQFLDLALAYADAHDQAVGDDVATFSFERIDDLAIAALAANYRIGAAELSLFEDVYNVTVRDALVHCALDFPTIRAWVAKKNVGADVGAVT
jgi:hypothetical protein